MLIASAAVARLRRIVRNCNSEEGTILVMVTVSLEVGRCSIKKHMGCYFKR
jgi:hypothetical protein